MYHPPTPRQSSVQSPVSFQRDQGEGGGHSKDQAIWTNRELQVRLEGGKERHKMVLLRKKGMRSGEKRDLKVSSLGKLEFH